MHADRLVAGAKERDRPQHVRAGEHTTLRPPERHLAPPAAADDGEELERQSGQRSGCHVERHAEPGCERSGVSAVAIEELDHAGRLAQRTNALVDARCLDRIEDPHPAAGDERVRRSLQLGALDPAEADVASRRRTGRSRFQANRVRELERPRQIALPTIAPSQPSSRSARTSASEQIPPAATTGSPAPSTSSRRARSGPPSIPSRRVAVTTSRATPSCRTALGEVARRRGGRPRPAVDGDPPVAHVDGDGELGIEALDGRAQERLVQSRGADEHSRGSGLECGRDELDGAIAAADLHRQPSLGDVANQVELWRPGEGAVEIDEVQPRGTRRREPRRGCAGIAAFHGHTLAAALLETDDPALENVDRRIDRERRL